MKFLHFEVTTQTGDSIRIDLSGTGANVMVMDDSNFRSYRTGGPRSFYGGHYTKSPALITPPSGGRWHVVVDLGGGAGNVNAEVRMLQGVMY